MKPCTRITLTIAAVLVTAGIAAGASLDRAGIWSGSTFVQRGDPAEPARDLLPDGSFEQGPPPASGWTEVTDGVCEWIGDNSGAWYVSAYDGLNDVWVGGYCDNNSGGYGPATTAVSQEVLIPSSATTLTFFYIALRTDLDDEPADGDRAYVAVNNVEVWTLPFVQANNTYPNWVGAIPVDLSAWADQTVTLTFGGVGVGEATGNVRFDYIELVPNGTPVESTTWGGLKSIFR